MLCSLGNNDFELFAFWEYTSNLAPQRGHDTLRHRIAILVKHFRDEACIFYLPFTVCPNGIYYIRNQLVRRTAAYIDGERRVFSDLLARLWRLRHDSPLRHISRCNRIPHG